MKLRNKKTGEIAVFGEGIVDLNQIGCKNVGEMIESGWEDIPEEPKVYYYISDFGAIRECEIGKFPEDEEDRKQIGNYFETEEESEKAVEKLKAFTRLEDKGFRFEWWLFFPDSYHPYQERIRDGRIIFKVKNDKEAGELLDTVFGGEE